MPDTPNDRADGGLPSQRALTPAERERVVERLGDAFAHDLVALDEFERRVALAYKATGPAELRALVADLDANAPGAVPARAAAGEPAQRIGAVCTSIERGGPQLVPARLEVRAFLANVELDFTRARLAGPFTLIDVRCVMANVEIRLPAGVRLDGEGGGLLGSFECQGAFDHVPPGAPVVRVLGRATLGAVRVSVDD